MTNDLVFLKICAIIFCSSTGLVDKPAKSNTNNTYFSLYKRRFSSFQAENMLISLFASGYQNNDRYVYNLQIGNNWQ